MPNFLQQARDSLRARAIDAFIIGSGDAHQSEYVAYCDRRRQFITGFTGSAGTAIITLENALLWTDGRYFFQASQELSSDWTLMKMGEPGVPDLNDYLCGNLTSGKVVGVDPNLISTSAAKALEKKLNGVSIKLLSLEENPIDIIWAENRPNAPCAAVNPHELSLAGQSHLDKIEKIQKLLRDNDVHSIVISMLDEVAWLFNIRGGDVDYNPVAIAYAVITIDSSHLFINANKLTDAVRSHLTDAVTIHPYEDIEAYLVELTKSGRVWIDPEQINWRLFNAVKESVLEKPSPITLQKSLKNPSELAGIRDAHRRDGAALTAFLCHLENLMKATSASDPDVAGKPLLTEFTAAEILEDFRRRDPKHVSPSFATIAGYGPNGAIIHYKPQQETAAILGFDSLFLLDSGAQYLDGTTDVTRTLHFGEPTEKMKRCFTLVLKGHIALARAVFPESTTTGVKLDTLARLPLWSQGLDYNHGTGHGVGAFLNVHEGPQSISSGARMNSALTVGFQNGMTISNEPGYYEEGAFGIRIENICITVPANTPNNFCGRQFSTFETVTLVPIQRKLIDMTIITEEELTWLNSYHDAVRSALLPLMKEGFPEAVDYLLRETEVIVK